MLWSFVCFLHAHVAELWHDDKALATHQSWVRCGGSYHGWLWSQNTTTSAGTAGPPSSGTRASCLPPRENISMRKGGKGWDVGVELTPGSTLGLNPQERKTCQQVNYLICPQGHAFLLNYCLCSPRRCQGNQILQAHIWHIMEANGKLEDIINWKDCKVSASGEERHAEKWTSSHRCLFRGKIIRLWAFS